MEELRRSLEAPSSLRGSYAEARWFLCVLVERATKEARKDADHRLVLVARQISSGWASVFEDFAFTPAVYNAMSRVWVAKGARKHR